MAGRIDPDYDPSQDEVEAVARFLVHNAHNLPRFSYKNGNGNGFGFAKWMMGLAMLLVAAGITAIATVQYTVVQRLSILETKVEILLMRK